MTYFRQRLWLMTTLLAFLCGSSLHPTSAAELQTLEGLEKDATWDLGTRCWLVRTPPAENKGLSTLVGLLQSAGSKGPETLVDGKIYQCPTHPYSTTFAPFQYEKIEEDQGICGRLTRQNSTEVEPPHFFGSGAISLPVSVATGPAAANTSSIRNEEGPPSTPEVPAQETSASESLTGDQAASSNPAPLKPKPYTPPFSLQLEELLSSRRFHYTLLAGVAGAAIGYGLNKLVDTPKRALALAQSWEEWLNQRAVSQSKHPQGQWHRLTQKARPSSGPRLTPPPVASKGPYDLDKWRGHAGLLSLQYTQAARCPSYSLP